jgi:hypothetical protein
MTKITACHVCGTTEGKAPLAAMCGRCADEWGGSNSPAPSTNGTSATSALTVKASAISSRRVKWLWRGFDPLGYLTISAGETKLGKSTFAALKIAMVTRGELPGEYENIPKPVLIVATEDGLSDIWKPRLQAVDANLDLVEFLNIPDAWNIRDGVELIDAALGKVPAALVFVDAVMEHLPEVRGAETTSSATFIRGALRPIARLAQARGVAIGLSTHPPKGQPRNFTDAYHGSGAFTQMSRSCLLFGWHPEDRELPEADRRRVIVRAAGNIGRDPGALAFRIGGKMIALDDGSTDEIGYAHDVQSCHVTARELLEAERGSSSTNSDTRNVTKTEELCEVIAEYLADGGWHPSLRGDLLAGGWSIGTVVAAQKRVAIVRKVRSMNGGWEWRLNNSSNSTRLFDSSGASRARSSSTETDSSTLHPKTPLSTEESKSQASSTNGPSAGRTPVRRVEESVSAEHIARVRARESDPDSAVSTTAEPTLFPAPSTTTGAQIIGKPWPYGEVDE